MIKTLDDKLNIRVLMLEDNPNTYYLSYQGQTKCVIDINHVGNDMIISPVLQGGCTREELDSIIVCFSDFMFTKYSEVKGILYESNSSDMLEKMGFKQVSKDSEYLYKENKKINKVR